MVKNVFNFFGLYLCHILQSNQIPYLRDKKPHPFETQLVLRLSALNYKSVRTVV